jgi:hypothetical protein
MILWRDLEQNLNKIRIWRIHSQFPRPCMHKFERLLWQNTAISIIICIPPHTHTHPGSNNRIIDPLLAALAPVYVGAAAAALTRERLDQ